jgi:hypothetical protein
MISRALDSNNDLIIENGSFKTVEDGAQTVQAVRSRLMFFLEEWFLDTEAGVPYYQKIFTKPADLVETESILKTQILRTDGIEKLITFEMEFEPITRLLTVAWSAETTYGIIYSDEVTIND